MTLNNYEKNNHWDLIDVNATREIIKIEDGEETYVEIDFTFTLKRLAKTHAAYIITIALGRLVFYFMTVKKNYFSKHLPIIFQQTTSHRNT